MTARKPRTRAAAVPATPGQALRARLDAELQPGTEWTPAEEVALSLAADQANRAAALSALLDAELAAPKPSAQRVTILAAEVRQLETAVAKMVATLDPDMTRVKSARHVAAANARWHR